MKPAPAVLVFAALVPAASGAAADKLKPAEVVAHHLDAVGAAEARATSRKVEGSCAMTAPASGGVAGSLMGRFSFEPEATRFALRMKFPSQGYPAESFGLEGGKPDVGFVLSGRRSALDAFLSTHDVILREGLLGGVLNAGWPLSSLAERGAKVSYDGLKQLDGRDNHRLRYHAKKGQDTLDVFLYFDPDTFRHVASVYKASQAQQLGVTMESSSSEPDEAKVTQYWKYDLVSDPLERK